MSRVATPLNEDACRVCGKEDDEEFLVLCDGCDRAFHTACHQGCTCCMTKPRNNFARKPAVPEGDWFCKFCAGRIPVLEAKIVWKPTEVHALDGIGVLDIACSETSTFVLGNDTNLYSVGTGLCGQLGHQDVVHEKLPHFRLLESMTEDKRSKGEGRFAHIHAGAHFGLVVTTAGHVYTWGNGEHGQLGHQENKNKKVPKKISALRELEVPVDLTACGSDFVIMTTKDSGDDDQFNTKRPGVFMSMGSNTQAQLGDASNKNQWVPQLLNNDAPDVTSRENADIEEPAEFLLGRDITQLAAGGSHAVAVVAGYQILTLHAS
uniref:PHD-type domain-containing protein n=1 Tax=Hyaloperonospora arabidopsidis (strain Emoy2) TaxID=559515 RepID=M4B9Y5_HYAAE